MKGAIKFMMKRISAFFIAICVLFTSMVTGCAKKDKNISSQGSSEGGEKQAYTDPVSTLPINASQDKFRNVYQILLYTFCDSNGDYIGDIQGLISKLDYINDGNPDSGDDLGADAIWLLPFTKSPSYHKYNTTDYYTIDPEYGTMDDFNQLVEECHKRGIRIIMDLVLNHTSTEHPWFIKACEELREGKTDGYAQMYSFVNSEDKPPYFAGVPDAENWWYECNFMPSFPELNLSSEMTREEISKILKFWTEAGIDGFRLDAVKYFSSVCPDSTDKADSVEFLEWLYKTAQSYNPEVYMVGELWESSSIIKTHYKSGIDSLFNFDGSGSTGKFANAIQTKDVYRLVSSMKRYRDAVLERTDSFIDAVFLSNHDMMRIGTTLTTSQQRKTAAALYMLMPGNSYIYYGEELGLAKSIDTQDASFRTAMVWSADQSNDVTPPGYETQNIPDEGGVAQQIKEPDSLLNFYRRVIRVKNQNPEIARGEIVEVLNFDDSTVAGYVTEYEGKKVVIIHNISDSKKTVTLPSGILENAVLRGDLYAADKASVSKDYVTLESNTVTLPAFSSAVLGNNE